MRRVAGARCDKSRNAGANVGIVENRFRTHGASGQLALAIVLPIGHGPPVQPRLGRRQREVGSALAVEDQENTVASLLQRWRLRCILMMLI